jgi:hypothetical protein
MQLRPLLSHVYARDREDYLPAELAESLLDEGPGEPNDLRSAYLADTAAVLLEDAVARLRAKSHEAAGLEAEAPNMPGEVGSPAASWRAREASWKVAALLRAMAMPREEAAVPDDVYWAAALIDACETGVKEGAARRMVGAAVLRRLAAHEDMLDKWIAQLRGRSATAAPTILQSLAGHTRPDPTAILGALQKGTLGYAPPDPRRLDPELVLAARATLADNLRALEAGAIQPIQPIRQIGSTGSIATAAPAQYNAKLQQMLQGIREAAAPAAPAGLPAAPAGFPAAPAAPAGLPAAPAAPAGLPAAPAAPAGLPAAPAAPAGLPAAPAAPAGVPAAPAAPAGVPAAPAGVPAAPAAPPASLPTEIKELVDAVA